MKQPWEWVESDLREMIDLGVRENLSLDYKSCDALQRTDGKIKEVSKDVSAFANSAGGTIVYGIQEDKNVPTGFDVGYDPRGPITKEWLDQIIASNIQQRINGIRIIPVNLPTEHPGRLAFVVHIPQSNRAPHMAGDHRYYKRHEFQSIPMEDYEVRDVTRRLDTPDLELIVASGDNPPPNGCVLDLSIRNLSPTVAFHFIVGIGMNMTTKVLNAGYFYNDPVNLEGEGPFQNWARAYGSSPGDMPLWKGPTLRLGSIHLGFPPQELLTPMPTIITVIQAPGMIPKKRRYSIGLKSWDSGFCFPRITPLVES